MFDVQQARVECPYCGEPLSVLLDPSDAGQAYEDTVARLLGEERPLRFIEQKKGWLKKLFGG